jgi:phospholipase/carboxylesterase
MKKVIVFIVLIALVKWWYTNSSIKVGPANVEIEYVVKYTGRADSSDLLPMLVALHGNGDTPNNFFKTALDKISAPSRVLLLKGPLKYGSGASWPWSKAEFDQYSVLINEAVETLRIKYPTKGKPVLVGYSGGGMMAYYSALHFGSTYSYIFPISGNLRNGFDMSVPLDIEAEVIAYHGKSDEVVAFGGGVSAVNTLIDKGVQVEFVEFNQGHHGLFYAMKTDISTMIDNKLLKLGY